MVMLTSNRAIEIAFFLGMSAKSSRPSLEVADALHVLTAAVQKACPSANLGALELDSIEPIAFSRLRTSLAEHGSTIVDDDVCNSAMRLIEKVVLSWPRTAAKLNSILDDFEKEILQHYGVPTDDEGDFADFPAGQASIVARGVVIGLGKILYCRIEESQEGGAAESDAPASVDWEVDEKRGEDLSYSYPSEEAPTSFEWVPESAPCTPDSAESADTGRDSNPLAASARYSLARPPSLPTTGKALFNPPKIMWVSVTEVIELRLAAKDVLDREELAAISRTMTGRGEVTERDVNRLGARMKAVLYGEDDYFAITSQSSAEQDIVVDETTHWDWLVRPQKAGNSSLTLRLTLLKDFEGLDLQRDLEALRAVTQIKVKSVWTYPARFWRNHWQWVIGTALALVGVMVSILAL